MPDTVLSYDQLNGSASLGGGSGGEGANGAGYATAMAASAGSAATALAGWAMSSALSSLSNSTTAPSVPDGKPISSAAELQSHMDGRSTPTAATVPPSSGLASLRLGSGSGSGSALDTAPSTSSFSATNSALDYDLDDTAPQLDRLSLRNSRARPDGRPRRQRRLVEFRDRSTKKKPNAVGRTKMAKAKLGPRRTAVSTAAVVAVQADPKQAISRSSLRVAAPVEEAWGEDGWDGTNEATPAAPAEMSASNSTSSLTTSQEITAQAFEAPVPKVDETWANFDDDEDKEEGTSESPAAAVAAVAAPMSKEEKKAELERKRNERRLMLEQLKREKEEARLRAL